MKKKLALLLSALMVVTAIPATAFAVTTNTVSYIANGTVDTVLINTKAPVLKMEDKSLEDIAGDDDKNDFAFKLTLDNAEWSMKPGGQDLEIGDTKEWASAEKETSGGTVSIMKVSASQMIVTVEDFAADANQDAYVGLPLEVELTDEGEASVAIDPMDSVISAGTYKFANVVEGSATVTINDTSAIREGVTTIETITIEEATAKSLEKDEIIKLKLNSDFTWANTTDGDADSKVKLSVYPNGGSIVVNDIKDETLELKVVDDSSKARTITLSNLKVRADFDDVEVGEICEVTVSGAGVDRTTLEVGTATDYSVSLSAENKTVPTFYSGRATTDEDTLEVTIKENITNSWITGRKAVLTFPSGVKVLDADVTKADNATATELSIEKNEVEFNIGDKTGTGKIKFEMTFNLSISPEFTGDITATLSGAAIGEDQEVVVGVAKAPITVEAETNEVKIDYRNVGIGDIMITEAFPGALEKGKTLSLVLEDMSFDGDPTVEVVEGDLEIDDVDVNNGQIDISIDKESAKTPAVLKVTNVELFLNRSLPAGDYKLKLVANDPYTTSGDAGYSNTFETGQSFGKVGGSINRDDMIDNKEVGDAFFQNSAAKDSSCSKTVLFDVRELVVKDDYVKVVTAGRDQDDSTFTTQIKVTIGANVLYAGDREIALDVPAYISNGYTMMPVRAVTEALSNVAIVRWDDPTHTVTITFGSRVISMTVGSNTMNINGVPVQMQAAVEITGERAFIPLRDLGYALGLNDSKIAWDDATKTATLN